MDLPITRVGFDHVVIIGAGGFARESREVCDSMNVDVLGYLTDPQYNKAGDSIDDLSVLGDLSYEPYYDLVRYFIAIGEPVHRYVVWKHHSSLRSSVIYATLVHNSVQSGRKCTILDGSIICGGSILTTNISVGSHVHINLACTIGHDCKIEDFVTLSPGVHVSGNVSIGTGTFIGTGAVIVEKIRIGSWCHIGAGAVVVKDVPDNSTVVGVPGKVVRVRDNDWQLH